MALVMGGDSSTQSCKAVVCDETLAVRGTGSVKYGTNHPRPDHAEQDPATWDAALAPAIASCSDSTSFASLKSMRRTDFGS